MKTARPFPTDAAAAARAEREAALRAARRDVILKGASSVFARDGLERATMRAIAAASGCTTGAIYPLFASKEEVYAALLSRSLSRLGVAVRQAMDRAATPRARLRAGAMAFAAYYHARPDEVALGLYLWNGVRPRGLTRDLDRDLNRNLGETLDLLQSGFAALGVADAAAAREETAALFAFLIGAVVMSQTGRLRLMGSDIDAIVKRHLDMVTAHLDARRGT